jgi:hypothetical protein
MTRGGEEDELDGVARREEDGGWNRDCGRRNEVFGTSLVLFGKRSRDLCLVRGVMGRWTVFRFKLSGLVEKKTGSAGVSESSVVAEGGSTAMKQLRGLEETQDVT